MASVQINTQAEQESSGAVGWVVGWVGERGGGIREASYPHRGNEGRREGGKESGQASECKR